MRCIEVSHRHKANNIKTPCMNKDRPGNYSFFIVIIIGIIFSFLFLGRKGLSEKPKGHTEIREK